MAFLAALSILCLSFLASRIHAVPWAGWTRQVNEAAQDPRCAVATFSGLTYPRGVTVTPVSATWLNAGESGYPGVPAAGTPARCLLIVNIRNSDLPNDSNYVLHLPDKTIWQNNNKRFLAVGNGAYIPLVNGYDVAYGTALGFAVASTDTGHFSDQDALNMTWAQNPGKLLDWTSRAMDQTVVFSKMMTQTYYGTSINFSYYSGCSTGGRQGLKQAQESPDNFDGILVGAPAWDHKNLAPQVGKIGSYQLPASKPQSEKLADATVLQTLHRQVLLNCDVIPGKDDVPDNIISYPEDCLSRIDWAELQCSGGSTDNCLTAAQITIAKQMYADYVVTNSAGQQVFVFPGMQPGSEIEWIAFASGDLPSTFDVQYQKNFLNHKNLLSNETVKDWNVYEDKIALISQRQDPSHASADNFAGLGKFKASNGKIMLYQGLEDATVPAKSADKLYAETKKALGSQDITDFFRYFQIPGMQHCYNEQSKGDANNPWFFGAGGQQGLLVLDKYTTNYQPSSEFLAPANNALMALVAWVEKSTAPTQFVATSFVQGSTTKLAQRPICLFGKRAVYDSVKNGDPNLLSSWSC